MIRSPTVPIFVSVLTLALKTWGCTTLLYMRKCDSPCHDDVIIRLGDDDVIVDLGKAVTRCLNDVILNDGQLSWNLQVRTSSSLLFVFRLSFNRRFILFIAVFPPNTSIIILFFILDDCRITRRSSTPCWPPLRTSSSRWSLMNKDGKTIGWHGWPKWKCSTDQLLAQ